MNGATFNIQRDTVPAWVMNIRATAYAASLDVIAPGIVSLIESTQASGEPWFNTFARLIPQINMTPEQGSLLVVEQARAAQNLAPTTLQNRGVDTSFSRAAQVLRGF